MNNCCSHWISIILVKVDIFRRKNVMLFWLKNIFFFFEKNDNQRRLTRTHLERGGPWPVNHNNHLKEKNLRIKKKFRIQKNEGSKGTRKFVPWLGNRSQMCVWPVLIRRRRRKIQKQTFSFHQRFFPVIFW